MAESLLPTLEKLRTTQRDISQQVNNLHQISMAHAKRIAQLEEPLDGKPSFASFQTLDRIIEDLERHAKGDEMSTRLAASHCAALKNFVEWLKVENRS